MFINDNDVGTACERSAELGERTDVQAVREEDTDFTSSREVEREKKGKERETERESGTEEEKGGGAQWGHARDCSYDVHERGRQ